MPALKNRFTLLDGMRGIAAIAVVVGHASHEASDTTLNPNMHLAVPFFFMLSGFVLAYAYKDKLKNFRAIYLYCIHRIIRLCPLLIAGGGLGSLFLWQRFLAGDLKGTPISHVYIAQFFSLCSLPTPFLDIDKWRWPANPPEWSLFCEFVASALLAFIFIRMRSIALLTVSLVGLGASIAIDVHTGAVSPGLSGEAALTLFAFTLGNLLYRVHNGQHQSKIRFLGVIPVVALLAIMFVPITFNLFARFFVLAVFIPGIIWVGAIAPPLKPAERIADFAGELSYPIYILHWPIMLWLKHFLPGLTFCSFVTAVIAVTICISYLVLEFYDKPLRRKLRKIVDRRFA